MRVIIKSFFVALISIALIYLLLQLRLGPKIENCNPNNCIVIEGKLSPLHLENIEMAKNQLSKVIVNSPGGKVRYGRAIAEVIYNTKSSVTVVGECSSACAEFILPAASSIVMEDSPIIGLHGNLFLYRQLRQEQGYIDSKNCPSVSRDWLENVYRDRNLSISFFNEQRLRLGDIDFDFIVDADTGCPKTSHLSYEYPMWFPNSYQLKELWGLKFEGEVCSDESTCRVRVGGVTGENICYFGESIRNC